MTYTYRYSRERTEVTTGMCPVCGKRTPYTKREAAWLLVANGTCEAHQETARAHWAPLIELEHRIRQDTLKHIPKGPGYLSRRRQPSQEAMLRAMELLLTRPQRLPHADRS